MLSELQLVWKLRLKVKESVSWLSRSSPTAKEAIAHLCR